METKLYGKLGLSFDIIAGPRHESCWGVAVSIVFYDGGAMKIISDTRQTSPVFLPTEIVIQIIYAVSKNVAPDTRQETLYSCCLVSRQWYSAAVPFLYERPRLGRGKSFEKFTAIVCPPVRAAKSRTNLGTLVRRLDMSPLVHHSSNSLTARLLGRVKENLEVFIAPAASFS